MRVELVLAFTLIKVVFIMCRAVHDDTPEEFLVMDSDAGADDAMALSLILKASEHRPHLTIAGITCVRGNTGVHNVSRNILKTLSVNDRLDIPVFEGCDRGLTATPALDPYFGYDGLGDFEFPLPPVDLRPDHPAVFLTNFIHKHPGKVTILALGPLTNLAVAGILDPEIFAKVKEIIYLGGSTTGVGGKGGVAFNNRMDPSAVMAVFSRIPSSKPITIVPSETTKNLVYSQDWRENVLAKKETKLMKFLNMAERKLRKRGTWKVSDQAAAGIFVEPSLVLGSYLGIPHVASNGSMTIEEDPQGTVKVISCIDKEHLQTLLETFL